MGDKPVFYHIAQVLRVFAGALILIIGLFLLFNPPDSSCSFSNINRFISIDAVLFAVVVVLLWLGLILGDYVAKFGCYSGSIDRNTGMTGLNTETGQRGSFEFTFSNELRSKLLQVSGQSARGFALLIAAVMLIMRGIQYVRVVFDSVSAGGFGLLMLLVGILLLTWRNRILVQIEIQNSSVTSEFINEAAKSSKQNRESGSGQVIVSTEPDGNDSFY